MFPSPARAHWGHPHYNAYPHPPYGGAPVPPASGPVYINASSAATRFQRRAPRRLVWFTLGSLATLWWINKRSSQTSHHKNGGWGGEYGWCHATTRSLPAPAPAPVAPVTPVAPVLPVASAEEEDRTRDSQGRRFGWRREERRPKAAVVEADALEKKKEEARQVWLREKQEMEERWKVERERMREKAEEAREKVRDFAATRLDEMLAALNELKKDLKPAASAPAPVPAQDSQAPRYWA